MYKPNNYDELSIITHTVDMKDWYKIDISSIDYMPLYISAYWSALTRNKNIDYTETYTYKPNDRKTLKLILKTISADDWKYIDTSLITNMDSIFYDFNLPFGDISSWDVSNVKSMKFMFYKSNFNGDISNWNVSNVKNMDSMFRESKFNGDISKWNVKNVKTMDSMFMLSSFAGDISDWDISNVKIMSYMFGYSLIKSNNLYKWNLSKYKFIPLKSKSIELIEDNEKCAENMFYGCNRNYIDMII